MRVVLQRVKSSQVTVSDTLAPEAAFRVIGKIGRGLNLLVGIAATDTDAEIDWMVRKCLELRVFPDDGDGNSKFDRSVLDIHGELLVVSQFTLYADCQKGRRPSLSAAAPPEKAEKFYLQFVEKLNQSGLHVATGQFGANMQVSIENDGPVTLWLERENSAGVNS